VLAKRRVGTDLIICGSSSSSGWLKMGVAVYDDGCGRGAKVGVAPKVGCEGSSYYTPTQIQYGDSDDDNKNNNKKITLTCGPGTSSSGN
jgi:hypothetical protein